MFLCGRDGKTVVSREMDKADIECLKNEGKHCRQIALCINGKNKTKVVEDINALKPPTQCTCTVTSPTLPLLRQN